ncbi:MAG: hypothetical protein GOU99_04045 [Candidatus Altiarchaeota archaeon]|nr:hypothetical protein [Candidatus Altiarchaeota archaeon]
MRKVWDAALLVGVALVIGIFLRYQGLEDSYIKAFDPFLFWRMADTIVTDGGWPGPDSLRYYPYGWESEELTPALPYTIAYLGKLSGDVKFAAKWYPAMFGILSLIVMGYIGRRFGMAGLPPIALAVIMAYLYRTSQGFADKEALAMFVGFLGWYFFIRLVETREWQYAVLSGVSLGLIATVWGGKVLYVLALIPFMLMTTWNEKIKNLPNYAMVLLIYCGMHYFVPRYQRFWVDPVSLFIIGIAGLMLLAWAVYKNKRFKKYGKNRLLIATGLGVALTIGMSFVFFGDGFRIQETIYSLIQSPVARAGAVTHYQTVAENQRPTWTWQLNNNTFWQQFGMFFFLSLPLIYFYFKGENDKEVLLGSIYIFLLYAAFSAIRLFVIAAPAIALAGSYATKLLMENKDKALVATGILLFVTGFYFSAQPTFAAAKYSGSSLTTTWYENMKWAGFNLPADEVLVTWWDYGYWIQTLSNRTSLGDGGNVGPGYILNWNSGHFLATDDMQNATDWLWGWNLSVVTIDSQLIPKYWAYSTLGGISDVLYQFNYYGKQPTNFGVVDVYGGYIQGYGPVAVLVVPIGDQVNLLLGTQTNQGVVWQGIVGEYAGVLNNQVYFCQPDGWCKSEAFQDYQVLNDTALFFYSNTVFGGDYQPMHSVFARLWFFDGLGIPGQVTKVVDNGETKTFVILPPASGVSE